MANLKAPLRMVRVWVVKSGHSGFYPLYLCQAEVCPHDAERQKKIERVTEMDGYLKKESHTIDLLSIQIDK